MRTGWIYSGLCSPEYIHIPFYPPLLSQRPRRGIAALRAGPCGLLQALWSFSAKLMNGFHSFAALNISKIRSILDIFFVLLYGLRRRASPFCLRFAPAVPTETIHQQLYFILPPAAVAATPAGYCGSLQSKLQALSYPPKKKPCRLFLLPPEGAVFLEPRAFTKTYFQHSAFTTRCPLQLSTNLFRRSLSFY